jgi:hypothetical protein
MLFVCFAKPAVQKSDGALQARGLFLYLPHSMQVEADIHDDQQTDAVICCHIILLVIVRT